MVPVVHEKIYDRHDRIKDPAGNAVGAHLPDELRIDEADGADVIIEDPDLHTACRLLYEDFLQLPEGDPVLDRVVLHEDKVLCISERKLLRLQSLSGVSIEVHLCIPVGRKAAAVLQKIKLVSDTGILL